MARSLEINEDEMEPPTVHVLEINEDKMELRSFTIDGEINIKCFQCLGNSVPCASCHHMMERIRTLCPIS